MFTELEYLNTCPKPFEFYTAGDLWTDEYISKQMLSFHLNEGIDAASRNTAFIGRSVDWITSQFNVKDGVKIADFGCGPGFYTIRLAKKLSDVTGIDFSNRSIQYAREIAAREGLNIHYVNQNYLEFDTEDRFDLILMIMCDYSALNWNQRNTLLKKFYTLLKPGGSVLLDVYSIAAYEQWKETSKYEINLMDGFWSPEKYYGFLNTFKYETEKLVLDKYTIVEAGRTRVIYNWFQCFTRETLENEFADCGFILENFYSDVAGSTYQPETNEFAVIAKKPV